MVVCALLMGLDSPVNVLGQDTMEPHVKMVSCYDHFAFEVDPARIESSGTYNQFDFY